MNWHPIDTLPYDEVVRIKRKSGKEHLDFWYDESFSEWTSHYGKDPPVKWRPTKEEDFD